MGYYKITFPCGMQIETKCFSTYYGQETEDDLYEKGCPIHGKKCPMKKGR